MSWSSIMLTSILSKKKWSFHNVFFELFSSHLISITDAAQNLPVNMNQVVGGKLTLKNVCGLGGFGDINLQSLLLDGLRQEDCTFKRTQSYLEGYIQSPLQNVRALSILWGTYLTYTRPRVHPQYKKRKKFFSMFSVNILPTLWILYIKHKDCIKKTSVLKCK